MKPQTKEIFYVPSSLKYREKKLDLGVPNIALRCDSTTVFRRSGNANPFDLEKKNSGELVIPADERK